MYKAVIYNPLTMTIKKHYKTMAAAKGAFTRMTKLNIEADKDLKVGTIAEFNALDVDVVVHNLMNGHPVTLRKSEVGGPCDPSTERYFSM